MIVYLASPNNQQQAEHVSGMPVLLSYACYGNWLNKGYQQSFARILVDSGAYSEFTSGKKIDLEKYKDWAAQWLPHADAVAGLDDIAGDWKKSLRNYEAFPDGFPTFHETDPPELLPDLIAMSRQRKQWLGLGLLPPRQGKERFVRESLARIPEDIHVHGWALREYTHVRRLDSVDSTNWWRDAMKVRTQLPWLHFGECLEIVVKRYQRWQRTIKDNFNYQQPSLFGESECNNAQPNA